MQTPANFAGPSNSADTLLIKPTALSTVYLGPGEIRQGERPVKSSWIRRLNPRDEMEHLIGDSAAGDTQLIKPEKYKEFVGNIELGLVTARAEEDRASPKANGLKARSNCGTEGVEVAKRQKIIGQDVAENYINGLDPAAPGEKQIVGAIQPSMTGFGPWINLNSGRNTGVKVSEVGCSKSNASNVLSTLDSFKQVHDRSSSTISLINARQSCGPSSTQADTSIPSLLGKQPLLPSNGKPGLPPRPPSQKTASCQLPGKFTSAAARGLLHQPLVDAQEKGQGVEMQHAIGRVVCSVHNEETGKPSELKFMGLGAYPNKPNPLEGSFLASCKAHTRDHEQGKSGQHLLASCSTIVGKGQLSSKHVPFVAEEGSAFLGIREQKAHGGGPQLERLRKGDQDLRHFCGGAMEVEEGLKDSDGSESAKNVARSSIVPGNSRCTSIVDKGEASSTAPPSLPWEMFTEPTGALRKEREQFVEVYNRARDELKKQRASQSVSRSLATETDGGPRLALGPGNGVSNSLQQLPALKQEELSAGHFPTPRMVKIVSASLEQGSRSVGLNLKDQCSVGLTSGEGPVVNPATLPISMKGATVGTQAPPCMQQPASSKQEQLLPGQLKLDLKTANYNKSIYRPDQSPVVFNHDCGGPACIVQNAGHVGSSSSAVGFKEPTSKLEEHIGHGGPNQADGLPLPSPLLGKRLRVTFEDLALSRIEEKCAASSQSSRRQVALHPHIWLSRWHATNNPDTRGSMDANISNEVVRNGFVRYFSGGLKNDDGPARVGYGRDTRQTADNKEGGWKGFNMGSSSALPSAAAMAIVGTAARQYCSSAQPQRAGSFAFWSGFGRSNPPDVEGMQGKGKEKVITKGNVNFPTC